MQVFLHHYKRFYSSDTFPSPGAAPRPPRAGNEAHYQLPFSLMKVLRHPRSPHPAGCSLNPSKKLCAESTRGANPNQTPESAVPVLRVIMATGPLPARLINIYVCKQRDYGKAYWLCWRWPAVFPLVPCEPRTDSPGRLFSVALTQESISNSPVCVCRAPGRTNLYPKH